MPGALGRTASLPARATARVGLASSRDTRWIATGCLAPMPNGRAVLRHRQRAALREDTPGECDLRIFELPQKNPHIQTWIAACKLAHPSEVHDAHDQQSRVCPRHGGRHVHRSTGRSPIQSPARVRRHLAARGTRSRIPVGPGRRPRGCTAGLGPGPQSTRRVPARQHRVQDRPTEHPVLPVIVQAWIRRRLPHGVR